MLIFTYSTWVSTASGNLNDNVTCHKSVTAHHVASKIEDNKLKWDFKLCI